jgi:hypothetical protein
MELGYNGALWRASLLAALDLQLLLPERCLFYSLLIDDASLFY